MNTEGDIDLALRSGYETNPLPLTKTRSAVSKFVHWLDRYGEESYDFQTYYSGNLGRRAKRLYYDRPILGTLAVLPMVFSEALFPSADGCTGSRSEFRLRMPITQWGLHFSLKYPETMPTTSGRYTFSMFSSRPVARDTMSTVGGTLSTGRRCSARFRPELR